MVILSEEDWAEIYYALDAKLFELKEGFYRENAPGDNAAWISHLDTIQRKIGPDGLHALRKGVRASR